MAMTALHIRRDVTANGTDPGACRLCHTTGQCAYAIPGSRGLGGGLVDGGRGGGQGAGERGRVRRGEALNGLTWGDGDVFGGLMAGEAMRC